MKLLDTLHGWLRVYLEHKLFTTVIGGLIFLNPVALAPQVWTVATTQNVAGVSLTMWLIFAAIQLAIVFEGIRVRSIPMFWSMLVSFLESITIVIFVLVRS